MGDGRGRKRNEKCQEGNTGARHVFEVLGKLVPPPPPEQCCTRNTNTCTVVCCRVLYLIRGGGNSSKWKRVN